MYSEFLKKRYDAAIKLVEHLSNSFEYVSVLGTDVKATNISVNSRGSSIGDGLGKECGFVVRVNNGKSNFEYSLDDIMDTDLVAIKILNELVISKSLEEKQVKINYKEEKLEKDFERGTDVDDYSEEELLASLTEVKDSLAEQKGVLNAICSLGIFDCSKMFISKNKRLTQHYTWVNGNVMCIYSEGKAPVMGRTGAYGVNISDVLPKMKGLIPEAIKKGHILSNAKTVTPGIYDIITAPSITGLIAHEAFGHGVEMDQFVKDRAMAKDYVGKYVASPICNMKDGAASALSIGSYFFDDDGILAHDTQIIKDGILVSGISDMTSATELGTIPTGNGRRESYKRKAYTRMTNTFFEGGKDKLEDMIASVKHGYMLFDTDNGMEDPKNWNIQCVASYGIEIIDGKLTENYIAPVVMSGAVLDLLKSISAVSGDVEVIGSGACGKGYKEWVRVSDGGPCLKAKVKLA